MSWSLLYPVSAALADVPQTPIVLDVFGSVRAGDLVTIGVASIPGGVAYSVADNAPPGSFAWVVGPVQVFASGTASVAMYHAVSSRVVPHLSVTIALSPVIAASWVVMGAIYRGFGTVFTDQTDAGSGLGDTLTGALLSPLQPDELAVTFGVVLPNQIFQASDPPLTNRLTLAGPTVASGCWADSLSTSSPLTPTMHLDVAGQWCLLGATYGITPVPPNPHPGSFLGSGLEPFPIRRKPERRSDSPRPNRRRRLTFDLLK